MKDEMISGGCLCGAVRYEGRGEPYHITHCHCADCRRSTGAAFVTWASFEKKNFRFVEGEPGVITWEGRLRSFCPTCGSSLTFLSGPDSEEVDVTVATFDEPECVTPADNVWISDRLQWTKSLDALPTHEQARTPVRDG